MFEFNIYMNMQPHN